jgi:alpha-L-rhamnosidase
MRTLVLNLTRSLKFLLLLATVSFYGCNHETTPEAINLKINHTVAPLGLDDQMPLLGWQISGVNTIQSAYQILVATSAELLNEIDADIWNSGKVYSEQSQHIPYNGKELKSSQKYYWKVRIWDHNGDDRGFSSPTHFEMGLLRGEDWRAEWISAVESFDSVPPLLPAPYFRKEFSLSGELESARLYISGLGYYEAFINDSKVGDHVLDPVKTHYDRRVKYVVHDVTNHLKAGDNAIGVVLGNGWYNQHTREAWNFDRAPWRAAPKMICQLVVKTRAGENIYIVSDDSWKFTQNGPIVFDGVHNGETYDARLELGAWSEPGYEDKDWNNAHVVEGPGGKFSAQLMPPIRIVNKMKPANTWRLNDSVLMVDLGQNITGWAGIVVKGPGGSMVKLRYGERIFEDGSLDQVELQRFIWTGDTQTGRYILKGEGEEQWHSVFSYHGFQYIEVTFSTPEIELIDIEGHVVYTDLPGKLNFSCSNDLFNRIHENLRWSFLGNYHGYPTDCPHREKMGWTGDALLVAEAGLFNFNMVSSYLKWIDDFVDEQRPNGQLPGIIPTSGWGYQHGRNPETRPRGYGPQWEGAFMEIPWQMYRFTGDTSILRRYYDRFKLYVDYLTAHSNGHLLNFGIDDHKQLENLTHGDYLSSAFYFRFTDMLSQMAGVLKNDEDQKSYSELAKQIKAAFYSKYFDPESGNYLHGGQTPVGLALYFGLVPEQEKDRVLQNLLQVINEKDGHIDAGVVGTKAVINTLLMYDQERILFEMVDKRTFPGWGYWIEEFGATTLYQNWDGSQSRNHIMFGSIGDYFYKGLAGIKVDDNHPGFKKFIIRPSVRNDLQWVEADFESPYGTIVSTWKKQGNGLQMNVRVPSNSTARIYVPGSENSKISFSKGTMPDYLGFDKGYHVYLAGPGSYTMRSSSIN